MNMVNARTVSEILAEADDVSRWRLVYPGARGVWVLTVIGRTVAVERPGDDLFTRAYGDDYTAWCVAQRTVQDMEARGWVITRAWIRCTCGQCPQNQD